MPQGLSPGDAERFLRGRHVGVLTTINADGTPLQTPIWYLLRDGLIYIRTSSLTAKARNIRRDPRVSLCVQDERPPYRGVTVDGRATVGGDDGEVSDAMARHYLGAVAGYFYQRLRSRRLIEGDPDATLVVLPERTYGWTYVPDTPLIGRLWLALKRVLPPWL